MTNYVSFSLYGNRDFYTMGAIENVRLCSTVYPGWTPIVYVDERVPNNVREDLEHLGALVIEGSMELSRNKMTWRLAPVLIPGANKVIFRDTDSRVGPREQACVDEWLRSGKAVHIMRDHPYHGNWIMGGMFGVDSLVAGPYVQNILSAAQDTEIGEDQKLLATELYRYLRNQTIVHDSFFRREKWAEAFPLPRKGSQFVGERIDEEGRPEGDMRKMLVRYEKSKLLRFRLRVQDAKRARTDQKLYLRDRFL
jgi:hypothetical protein